MFKSCIMSDSKLTSMVFVATIKPFNGSNIRPAEEDINGLPPVILDVVAGSCPNKRVLSGTVAKRAGMEENSTYLCKFEEIDATEYGRQFRFSTIIKLEASQILEGIKTLGPPVIIEVIENNPEVTKSGNYSYPKGFTAEEKVSFNLLSAEEQDTFLESKPDSRTHHV